MRCLLNSLMPAMVLSACVSARAQTSTYHVGRTPSEEEIRAWDISVGPAGKEPPPGSGSAKEGAKIFAQRCAACHGPTGTEGPDDPLVGGQGTLNTLHPLKTVGSYWPFATTVWDYINRGMPYDKPGTLSAAEVYALTAFLLYRNGIIRESEIVDAKSLPKVEMPNRKKFIPSPWPDLKSYHSLCHGGICP